MRFVQVGYATGGERRLAEVHGVSADMAGLWLPNLIHLRDHTKPPKDQTKQGMIDVCGPD